MGIERIGKIIDSFISGLATSVSFVLILVWNSQWHTPDRKNSKPAVERIWLDAEKKKQGGWGYGISRGIEEIVSGFSRC